MAKKVKAAKAAKPRKPRKVEKKLRCECPSDEARREFREAKTCSGKTRALDKLKAMSVKDADVLKPGQKALLFRDLLMKEQQRQNICAKEEAEDTARFNGLAGMRRKRRKRRRR